MEKEGTLAEIVGLRHVIEDGLAILEHRPLSKARRDFVVLDLKSLLQGAERGSELLSGASLFLRHQDSSALEYYALLDRLVGGLDPNKARKQLKDTFEAFRQLEATEEIEESQRISATNFLSALLANVSADQDWDQLEAAV